MSRKFGIAHTTEPAVKPRIDITKFTAEEHGSEGDPAINFAGALDTGIFLRDHTDLAFTVGGHERVFLSQDALTTHEPIVIYEAEVIRPNINRAGVLYKKRGDPSLYWYAVGIGEVNLLTGMVNRHTGGRTIIVPEDNDNEELPLSGTNPFADGDTGVPVRTLLRGRARSDTKYNTDDADDGDDADDDADSDVSDAMGAAAASISLVSSRRDFIAVSDTNDIIENKVNRIVESRMKAIRREFSELTDGIRVGLKDGLNSITNGVSSTIDSLRRAPVATQQVENRRDESHPCSTMYEFTPIRDTQFDHPHGYLYVQADQELRYRNNNSTRTLAYAETTWSRDSVIHVPTGTVTTPSYSFAGTTDGFYYDAGIHAAVGGADTLVLTRDDTRIYNQLLCTVGSLLSPSIAFNGNSATGINYTDDLQFVVDGVCEMRVGSAGVNAQRFTAEALQAHRLLVAGCNDATVLSHGGSEVMRFDRAHTIVPLLIAKSFATEAMRIGETTLQIASDGGLLICSPAPLMEFSDTGIRMANVSMIGVADAPIRFDRVGLSERNARLYLDEILLHSGTRNRDTEQITHRRLEDVSLGLHDISTPVLRLPGGVLTSANGSLVWQADNAESVALGNGAVRYPLLAPPSEGVSFGFANADTSNGFAYNDECISVVVGDLPIAKFDITGVTTDRVVTQSVRVGDADLMVNDGKLQFAIAGTLHTLSGELLNTRYTACGGGSASAPAFALPDASGLYTHGNHVGISVRGVTPVSFSSEQVLATNGSLANPSYSFATKTAAGMYLSSVGVAVVNDRHHVIVGDAGVAASKFILPPGDAESPSLCIGGVSVYADETNLTLSSDFQAKRIACTGLQFGDATTLHTVGGRLMWGDIDVFRPSAYKLQYGEISSTQDGIVITHDNFNVTIGKNKLSCGSARFDKLRAGSFKCETFATTAVECKSVVAQSIATDTAVINKITSEHESVIIPSLTSTNVTADNVRVNTITCDKIRSDGLSISTQNMTFQLNTHNWQATTATASSASTLKPGDVVGVDGAGAIVPVGGFKFTDHIAPLPASMIVGVVSLHTSDYHYMNIANTPVKLCEARSSEVLRCIQLDSLRYFVAVRGGGKLRMITVLISGNKVNLQKHPEQNSVGGDFNMRWDVPSEMLVLAMETPNGVEVQVASVTNEVRMGVAEKCLRTREHSVHVTVAAGSSFVVCSGSERRAGFINAANLNCSLGTLSHNHDIEECIDLIYFNDTIVLACNDIAGDNFLRTFNLVGNEIEVRDSIRVPMVSNISLVGSETLLMFHGSNVHPVSCWHVDIADEITFHLNYKSNVLGVPRAFGDKVLVVGSSTHILTYATTGVTPDMFVGVVEVVAGNDVSIVTRGGIVRGLTIAGGLRVYIDATTKKFTQSAPGNYYCGISLGNALLLRGA